MTTETKAAEEHKQHAEENKVTFHEFIIMMSTQALFALGVVPNPENDKYLTNLPMARRTIDMLAMIREKTRGNLAQDEESMLDDVLHQLRIRFIDVVREESEAAAGKSKNSG